MLGSARVGRSPHALRAPRLRRRRFSPALACAAALVLEVAPAAAQVSGTVRDAATQAPLAGAHVRVQGNATGTLTDANGAYTLPLASGTVVVVAAEVGFFNLGHSVTAPALGTDFALERVPAADNPNYQPFPPGACALCHPRQYLEWSHTDMAAAGTNTWVADTYDGSGTPGGSGGFVYVRDSVLAAQNPASECRSCHQPEAWLAEPYSALTPVQTPTPAQAHGVSCEVCHKVAHIDESKPNFPGLWPGVVTLTRPFDTQVMYGVLDDVNYAMPYGIRASYQPQLGAALCAACHQDKNDPDGNGDFEEPNGVISEPTYLEWLASPYADPGSAHFATCVRCHMPPAGSQVCNVLGNFERPRGQVRSHVFAGTTPAYLDNAVTLALVATLAGNAVEADVTVTNDATGHHVPTGVTTRNVILLVQAFRESNGMPLAYTGSERIDATGGVDANGESDAEHGYFGGLPGKLFAKKNHDANGAGPVFFTDAVGVTSDTRIAALASDTTHYSFAAPLGGGPVRVRARLIYRRAWRKLVDAKGWTRTGHDEPLEDVAPPHFGHLMEMAETSVLTPPECVLDADCPPASGLVCADGVCVPSGAAGAGGSSGAGGAGGVGGVGGVGGIGAMGGLGGVAGTAGAGAAAGGAVSGGAGGAGASAGAGWGGAGARAGGGGAPNALSAAGGCACALGAPARDTTSAWTWGLTLYVCTARVRRRRARAAR